MFGNLLLTGNIKIRNIGSKIMDKLRELKARGELQKVELFPELKWYHKLWNKIIVRVVNAKN